MANETVKELAEVVGVSVDKLLQQMQDAGLSHAGSDHVVTDDEKQALLSFLKKAHGQDSDAKKITLRRKSVSQVKVSGQSGRSKTVSVEVRKKRTYVKRDDAPDSAEEQTQDAADHAVLEDLQQTSLLESNAAESSTSDQSSAENQDTSYAEQHEPIAKKPASYDDSSNKRATRTHADDRGRPKRSAVLDVVSTSSKAADSSQPIDAEAKQRETQKREEERRRRELDEKTRKEKDELARKKTLEAAKRVAEELEKRGGNVDTIQQLQQDEPEVGGTILKQALEESYAAKEKDDRRIKRVKKSQQQENTKLVLNRNRKLRGSGQHGFQSPTGPIRRDVRVGEDISVADLANQMSLKATKVIGTLMKLGVVATVNQNIDRDTAIIVVEELGHNPVLTREDEIEHDFQALVTSQESIRFEHRAPVVTIMGHVDHGKTSLLDYIRSTKVAPGEAGGITQHIGAYHVETERGMITFLDTPGHAAFSLMRARGAQCTDIVILVVAADDGVMPQTVEAINHARAANVPIIVAVNKMDKESADPERVRNELSGRGVIAEEWGGDTQFVPVSAHTGLGIDELLEAILLQSEVLELTAAAEGPARGVVIESRLDRNRGAVTTLLVQSGRLKAGDMVLAGTFFGRAKALFNELGQMVDSAGPSLPVEVLGLNGVPDSGDQFLTTSDEKKAREVAEFRQTKAWQGRLKRQTATKLEDIFDTLKKDEMASVNLVIKADVRGSMEAIIGSLVGLSTDEVKVQIVASGVGGITESDVSLALTSSAIVVGFNTRVDGAARRLSEIEGVEVRYYSVIYDIIDDVKKAMSGLLEPELREEIIGTAEVRDVFRSSKFGAAAGCMVIEGSVFRNKPIRVLRNNVVVFEGELESLRRFKEDAAEVRQGMECGIAVKSYKDIQVGDVIEVFQVKKIARTIQ